MGRKKKKNDVVEETSSDEGVSFLHGDAKRSIVAIILFVLALLSVLGFFGVAGMVGDLFNQILGQIFGWGKIIFPPTVLIFSIFLLKRRQNTLSDYVKLVGLIVAFWSLLGAFHLFIGKDMAKAASLGTGGGYLGYFLAGMLQKFTGTLAGAIILLALFSMGLVLSFNLSILHFLDALQKRFAQKGARTSGAMAEEIDDSVSMLDLEEESLGEPHDANEEEVVEIVDQEALDEALKKQEAENKALEAENIRRLVFETDKKKKSVVKEVVQDDDEYEEEDEDADEEEFEHAPARIKAQRKPRASRKWVLPKPDLLEAEEVGSKSIQNEHNAVIIQQKLKHFDIDVEIGDIQTGPTVTQYTFRPTPGTKLSKITALSSELAYELAAQSVRIEAPIPGKSLVGIEVPNQTTSMVRLQNIILSQAFTKRTSNLMLVLGQDVVGEYIVEDLAKMPHLLVAGSTNSGKSVCINSLLLSLLYQNSPDDLKMILVDPKRVELSLYNKIPHLLTDVIVENKKVVNVLKWAVSEMERRYKVLQETGSRDLGSYRQKIENGEKRPQQDNSSDEAEDLERLPYIIIVIDEMADLIMAHGKDVEGLIARLAQMSRAVGIHLILATQRPSVEVLTGLIKANITTRIAFKVATQIDSRTILDQGGAEKLLGKGDMLYLSTGNNQPKRLQGVFISESEVKRVVDELKKQKRKDGNEEDLPDEISGMGSGQSSSVSQVMNFDIDESSSSDRSSEDDLYGEAKNLVIQAGKASASLLQRRLRVGYSRAARILYLLEEDGIIGPADGAKPREVYADASGGDDGYDEASAPESESVVNSQEKRDSWHM